MIIKKIKSIKPKVIELLENYPHLRDSDSKLIANIWHSEIGVANAKKISAFDLLTHLSKGEITSGDIITRARRKIQEEREDLRGLKYNKRKKLDVETRQTINL